jgi:hypothetical protein
MNILLNVALFQLIWALCVIGQDTWVWLALGLIMIHLLLSPARRADLQLMGVMLILGSTVDGLLHLVGFFTFRQPGFPIPLWLAVLWVGLATQPHYSLGWMKKRLLLASVFGAVGGPLAYWAGVRIGAAEFGLPLLTSLFILAIIWSMLWPTAMYAADRFRPAGKS